jgi:hypothetical protein
MSAHRPLWDDEDEDKTPYGVSGEALPPRPDVVGDAEVSEAIVRRQRRKAEVVDDDDDPADDPPVRKKKRRKKDRTFILPDVDDERDKENEKREWLITGSLAVAGLALMLAGAVGVSGKKDYETVSTAATVLVSLVGLAVTIPVVFVTLAVAGSVVGIEYGTPLSAFRNVTAILIFLNGLDWVAAWLGLFMIGHILTLVVGIGLFMNRFDLDIWEMIASVIAIKLVSVAVQIVILFIAFGRESNKIKAAGPETGPAVAAVNRAAVTSSSCT